MSVAVVFFSPLLAEAIRSATGRDREEPGAAGKKIFRRIWALIGVLVWLGLYASSSFYVNVLWFRELGYSARFWTVFRTKLACFLAASIFFFLTLMLNRRLACGSDAGWSSRPGLARVIVSLLAGLLAVPAYQLFLLWHNATPFGIADPIFGRDVGFYVFSLPFLNFLLAFCVWWWIALTAFAVQSYVAMYLEAAARDKAHEISTGRDRVVFKALSHISILGSILMIIFVFETRLAMFTILYSTRGAVYGAGYTDVHVLLPAYRIFLAVLVLAAIFLVYSAFSRSLRTTKLGVGIGFGTAAAVWLILVRMVPALYQAVVVSPNEIQKEREYIMHDIAMTRAAYGLAHVTESEFPVNADINAGVLKTDQATLGSIRLWDWRALGQNYSQKQNLRSYYVFPDVDVDRYNIGGKIVQMMWSARELDQDKLTAGSKTWQNLRLVYTHGFGACASPVNIFTPSGDPDYWVKDIPPVSRFPQLEITQPRIYYGEKTDGHVYVRTRLAEFDHPVGDRNQTYTYDGEGGIPLGAGLRKLAIAVRFDGIRLLTSRELTPESRLMFRRDIHDRVRRLAPFLMYDNDPFQTVVRGDLYYIWDAYTVTSRYPYSQPIDFTMEHGSSRTINYIRNSVKVVVNAFSGRVSFYIYDDSDPIIKAWSGIFPGFFRPAAEMDPELALHMRYPEDLLDLQGRIYSVYHMDDPTVFYNKEDAWEISKEFSHGQKQPVLPYFVTMKIPGEEREEFIQMLPFSPRTTDQSNPRNNMVGWLAGRCDGARYGQLILYKFPKNKLVYGPLQISIRMNQDDVISKDFTLWNAQGSQVVTGNLLVIPLSDYRILYVQPIYLAATVGKMPELKRVVVVCGERLAYAKSFEEALGELTGTYVPPAGTAAPSPVSGQPAPDTEKSRLIREAAGCFKEYKQLVSQGKLAEAGKQLDRLGELLNRLSR